MAALDDASIAHILQEREQARAAKDWASADKLREQLRANGIEVYDKDKTYHNTLTGARGTFGAAAQVLSGHAAVLDDHSITTLLLEREKARAQKDFAAADALRDRLRSHGVDVFDRERVWSTANGRRGTVPDLSGGGFVMPGMMGGVPGGGGGAQGMYGAIGGHMNFGQQMDSYGGRGNAGVGVFLSEGDIAQTVLQREAARMQKNYTLADQIRASLRASGVDVFDDAKLWKAQDGRVGLIGGFGAWGAFRDAEIMSILSRRDDAKALRDFPTADKIRSELRARGIEVYDKDREWRAEDGRRGAFPPAPGSSGHPPPQSSVSVGTKRSREAEPGEGAESMSEGAALEPLAETEIVRLLGLREGARRDKDWATADSLREQLRRHGVEIQDKERLWRCAKDGRRGTIGNDVTCTLSDAEIAALVLKREDARKAKDFEAADVTRSQLREKGVELFDKDNYWRANDGRRGNLGQQPAAFTVGGHTGLAVGGAVGGAASSAGLAASLAQQAAYGGLINPTGLGTGFM